MASAPAPTTAPGTGNTPTRKPRGEAKPLNTVQALGRIGNILDKLEPAERDRVLAFLAPTPKAG